MCLPLNPHSSSSATQGLNTSIMRFLKRVIKHNLVVLVVKNPTASAGDVGSVPRSGRCPGGGHGNPLRYSCLENPVDRGTSQATVHTVAKSQTRLKQLSMHVKDNLSTLSLWSKPTLFPMSYKNYFALPFKKMQTQWIIKSSLLEDPLIEPPTTLPSMCLWESWKIWRNT